MSSTNKASASRPRFVKKSVSIPANLESHIKRRLAEPVNRHNFSAYISSLILDDRATQNRTNEPCAASR